MQTALVIGAIVLGALGLCAMTKPGYRAAKAYRPVAVQASSINVASFYRNLDRHTH